MRGFFRRKTVAQGDAETGAGAGATVLVVDDSPTETHIFTRTLTKAGFKVETASNGEDGVIKARQLLPDLIVMDIVMPVLNGFQATRQLQRDAKTAHIPIIIVTTKDQETDRAWGLRQGAVDYLVKPVEPDVLVTRIRTALGG